MLHSTFLVIGCTAVSMLASAATGDDIVRLGSHVPTYPAELGNQGKAVSSRDAWQLKTAEAYFSTYSYYCAPAFHEWAADLPAPDGLEVAIYTSALRVTYSGDCRAFYLAEIAPRLHFSRVVTSAFRGPE